MKKGLIMIVMLGFAIACRAQQVYDTFLIEGKTWTQEILMDTPFEEKQYKILKLDGEMVIDGRKCMKLYCDGIFDSALYEEGKSVFRIVKGEEYKLYDFGAGIGDVLTLGGQKLTLVRIDTLYNDDFQFRRQIFLNQSNTPISHLSGIGSVSGPINISPTVGTSYAVVECKVGDNVLIPSADGNGFRVLNDDDFDEFAWYVDYMRQLANIKSTFDCNDTRGLLYDLHGRRLTSKPEKGVYIEGGRKRVAGK